MSNIKILHVLKSNSYSGAENVVVTLINSMREAFPNRYEMIYASPDGPIREILKRENIIFEPLVSFSIKEIRRIFRKCRPNIVHAHDFTASILCALTIHKTPLISHLHNNPPWIRSLNLNTIAYRLFFIRFRQILGVSNCVFDEFYFKSIHKKAIVISNPVNITAIRQKSLLQPHNALTGDIIFLGRLTEQKNPLRFIRLVSEVLKLVPHALAIMIGDGELSMQCERLIQDFGLTGRIVMMGFMENPYSVLAKAKVLCMPSIWEGFGLVAVESLALGVPVIASPAGALPGIVDEACGAICEDDQRFIDAMSELLDSPDVWLRKSKAAICKAENMENIAKYASKVNDIYANL